MEENKILVPPPAALGEKRFSRTVSGLRSRRKNPKLTGTGQSEAIREQQVGLWGSVVCPLHRMLHFRFLA